MSGQSEGIAHRLVPYFSDNELSLIPVSLVEEELLREFDMLIFGMDAYTNGNQLMNPWKGFKKQVAAMNLQGKKVAIFCNGNQQVNTSNFMNDMRDLADVLATNGSELVGHFPNENYQFESSAALVNGHFYGLPLDETNQPHLTNERLERWSALLQDKVWV